MPMGDLGAQIAGRPARLRVRARTNGRRVAVAAEDSSSSQAAAEEPTADATRGGCG